MFTGAGTWADIFVTEVAAWAWIHSGDEHDVGWVVDGGVIATNGDDAIFEGLSKAFEDVTAKFGEFIEEEDAVMSEGDFAGAWRLGATADEADIADGVVRGAEGAL